MPGGARLDDDRSGATASGLRALRSRAASHDVVFSPRVRASPREAASPWSSGCAVRLVPSAKRPCRLSVARFRCVPQDRSEPPRRLPRAAPLRVRPGALAGNDGLDIDEGDATRRPDVLGARCCQCSCTYEPRRAAAPRGRRYCGTSAPLTGSWSSTGARRAADGVGDYLRLPLERHRNLGTPRRVRPPSALLAALRRATWRADGTRFATRWLSLDVDWPRTDRSREAYAWSRAM